MAAVRSPSGPWPPGAALAHLLGDMAPAEFLEDYYGRRPLHLGGRPDHYHGLFEMDGLLRAVQTQHETGLVIRASGDHEGDDGHAGAHVPVDASQLADVFDRGASVCVDPVDRADARLADYAAALKRDLCHPGAVSVKCYLSPAGYGFNTHLDAHVVTTLQIEGRKRWRVSPRPGVREPLDNAFVDAGGEVRYAGRLPSKVRDWERPPVDAAEFEELVLEPGDLLCLPAGTWHEAKALERSLALNIAFAPLPAFDLLEAALRPLLADREAWRSSVPPALDDGAEPPEAVRQFLSDRIRDLIGVLEGLDAGGEELAGGWRSSVAGTVGPQPRTGLASPAAAQPAGPPGQRAQLRCVLTVSSLPRAIEWYESVLGMGVVSSIPGFGWAELAGPVPGVLIGLSELAGPEAGGGAVLNFGVADVPAARAALEAAGVEFDGPIREIAGTTRLTSFADPDGNRLMLHDDG